MKKLSKKEYTIWEIVGYISLALCIFGQITVGYIYLISQAAYLIANIVSVARDFRMGLPTANKVKDIFFTAITIGLIAIRIVTIMKGV